MILIDEVRITLHLVWDKSLTRAKCMGTPSESLLWYLLLLL